MKNSDKEAVYINENYRIIVNTYKYRDPVCIEKRGTDYLGDPKWEVIQLVTNLDIPMQDFLKAVVIKLRTKQ